MRRAAGWRDDRMWRFLCFIGASEDGVPRGPIVALPVLEHRIRRP
jgi:hypothetical protein